MNIRKNALAVSFIALKAAAFLLLFIFCTIQLKAQLVTQGYFTGIIAPKYMASGTSSRLPVVFRARVTGLQANSTYRYYVQGTTNSSLNGASLDFGTSNSGAGNALLISQNGATYTITTSPGLSTSGTYETFTTDANGSYTGWFGLMNTGGTRFNAGNEIYPTLTLNNGNGGSTPALRFALDVSIKTLALNTSASATSATGIWSISSASAKNIIVLYDNTAGTGRPLSATYAENENNSPASTPSFYSTNVNGVNGAWGALLPNINSNGLRRIEQYNVADGNFTGCATDADGIWPTGNINTVNPTGGTTAIKLNGADAPLNTSCGAVTSFYSDVYATPDFQYPQNIAYMQYQENASINNSTGALTVASFDVRDGGGSNDADAFSTILKAVWIKVNKPAYVRRAAIYSGTNMLAETTMTDSVLKFENLNFSVADNITGTLTLKISFTTNVVDNEQLIFTVAYAEADAAGSGFINSAAGASSTTVFNDNNRIEVNAGKLAFSVQPPANATVFSQLSSSPSITAQDEFGNTDVDFSYMVTLENTSGLGMLYNTQAAVNGVAVFNQLQFTSAGNTYISASANALTPVTANLQTSVADAIYWTGNAGNNLWNNSANWSNNAVPSANDIVVLDNSYVTNSYTIILPDTASAVKYIKIAPASNKTITVTLPATNTACPGFTAGDNLSNTDDLVLDSGAIFINAGGCSTANGLAINSQGTGGNGTFKINNGGKYIHRNSKGHTELLDVAQFSSNSNLVFDVSAGTSYVISISGRTFGNLTLSAAAKGATQAYSSNYANAATIKGNLVIESGATLSLSGNGYLYVGGNMQNSGSFSTGTGSRKLVMNGTQAQAFSGTGTYTIKSLEINNSSAQGVTLNSSIILSNSAGGSLTLTKGLLNTSAASILTLEDVTTISGGSKESFVNGPLQKMVRTTTQTSVVLPVGKDTFYRPVTLKPQVVTSAATFRSEYFASNPNSQYNVNSRSASLTSVSQLEYWKIEQLSGSVEAGVALGWGSSSLVDNTAGLRVAKWNGSVWNDEGQASVSGSSSYGDVTSVAQTSYGTFTLATTNGNPLPVTWLGFSVEIKNANIELSWKTACELNNSGFEIQRSFDGKNWRKIGWMNGHGTSQQMHTYMYTDENALGAAVIYYRLKQVDFNGAYEYSKTISVKNSQNPAENTIYIDSQKYLHIKWNSYAQGAVMVEILNMNGQSVGNYRISENTYIPMAKNASGVYVAKITGCNGEAQMHKFVLP